VPARLLGHALGGRDLALGIGALATRSARERRRWLLLSSIADLTDAAATVRYWPTLPARGRLAVIVASGSAAAIGLAGAIEA